jgi:hypothetical protein
MLHVFSAKRVKFPKRKPKTRDESGTDIIRPTDRPKGSDIHMVRPYSNPDI